MENNLTKEQVSRVFAMYLGCEVWEDITKHTCELVGVDATITLLASPDGLAERSFSRVKLSLTPLTAITDEHAIDVAKIFDGNYSHPNQIARGKYLVEQNIGVLPYAVFQYLILKGYAVPLYMGVDHPDNGKDAIQLRLAIERQQPYPA
jgi:hypothetical protein